MEESILIKAQNSNILVDTHDDGVWLSLQVRGGSAYTSLTVEQARELIAALQNVVDQVV